MASDDARVKEVEVLYHFASSIGRAGGGIAGAAAALGNAVYQEHGEFRSLLNTIERNLETARGEYADALSDFEDDPDGYNAQALEEARERLHVAESAYEEGLTIYQLVEPLLMNIQSRSCSFSQSIMSSTDRAEENVRLAATRLQQYITH